MSAPATKAFGPAPVINAVFISSLFNISLTASSKSVNTSLFNAFNFSGRLTVIIAVPFSISKSKVSKFILHILYFEDNTFSK